jgi:hypothetical protein
LKNAAKGTFKMHAIQNVCHIGVFIEYEAKEHSKCMPFKMYAILEYLLSMQQRNIQNACLSKCMPFLLTCFSIDKAPTILSIA